MKYTKICIYFQRNLITKNVENNVCLCFFQHLYIFRKYVGHQYIIKTFTTLMCTCGKHKLAIRISRAEQERVYL